MPRKDGWMLYAVSPEVKRIVRIYAVEHDLQIGHAINEIILEWNKLKKNSEDMHEEEEK